MKLRSIYEDFDKAVAVATKLVKHLNAQLGQMPVRNAQSKMFTLANAIADNYEFIGQLTPPESEMVFDLIGQRFKIDPTELRTAYDTRLQEIGGYGEDADEYQNRYSPGEWLRNYARHSHMPITARQDQPGPETPGSAELPPELVAKLAKLGVKTAADLAKVSKVDLVKAGISLADIKQLAGSKNLNSAPTTEYRIRARSGHGHIDYGSILEMVFGHQVVQGTSPFDRFLAGVDGLYLDFDPADPRFQALAQRLLHKKGKPWLPTPDEWIDLIMASSQQPELQERLAAIIAGTATATQAAGSGSGGKVVIRMKRGTVIDADHAVFVPSTAGGTGHFLVGIGQPGPVRISENHFCRHPEFMSWRMVPRPPDPHSTQYELHPKFSKILSMMPQNIADITWPHGRVQTF